MRIDLYKNGGYGSGGMSQTGGNISGPLILAGNPSQTLEAVPKQYVDAYWNSLNAGNFTSGTLNAARLPGFEGDLTSAPGTSVLTLSNTGVVAGSYGNVTVNSKGLITAGGNVSNTEFPYGASWNKITTGKPTTLNGYGILDGVNKAGSTLTGFLIVNNAPISNSHIANKQYVDSLISAGGVSIGDILRKPFNGTPTGFFRCNGAELDKTTYADLYAVIGDSFNNTNTAGSGQPWAQQYQINDTQNSDITGWTTGTSLTQILYAPMTFVTKNRIYMCGGNNLANAVSTVYTAPINADGTIGTWATTTSMPGGLAYASTVVTKNRVYVIGGWVNGPGVSTVYTAPINSDGTLGTWTTDTSIPVAGYHMQSVLTKNRVYLFGGYDTATGNKFTMYSAPVNSDGTIGTWIQEPSLPTGLSYSTVIATKNRIYLLSSYNGTSYTSTVLTASINTDGTLGTWTNGTPLPFAASSPGCLVTKNRVYLMGGYNGTSAVSSVISAPINSDGTLGTWIYGTPLPGTLQVSFNNTVATKNRVYLLGGWNGTSYTNIVYTAPISGGLNDYSLYYAEGEYNYETNYLEPGSGKPWQQQFQINQTQTADITGWASTTALPGALAYSQAIVTKNRVYLIGGQNATTNFVSTVYTAPINTDGTIGTWTTGTSLPSVLTESSVIVTKNRVYLLGGYNNSVQTSTVLTAPINSDGTLGTWVNGTSLPSVLGLSQAIITKNRVYLLGGLNATVNLSTVITAPINIDGSLGTWTTSSNSLPGALREAQAIVTKNRVYLIANTVCYTATISYDGYIGAWTTGPSLPAYLSNSQAIVTKNRVYMIGGYNSGPVSVVYHAPINADGTIGAWTTGTALPAVIFAHSAIVTKNRVYIMSGYANNSGVPTTNVYTASLLEGLNDYSPYYDGTILPGTLSDPVNKFLIPNLTADEYFGSYSYIKY